MVLVVKEAINSPWSSRMKAVGRAVWVVGSNTPKEREISPVLSSTRGMLRPFREMAANSLKKDRMAHTTQDEPVRLNGVCGDGDDGALLTLE